MINQIKQFQKEAKKLGRNANSLEEFKMYLQAKKKAALPEPKRIPQLIEEMANTLAWSLSEELPDLVLQTIGMDLEENEDIDSFLDQHGKAILTKAKEILEIEVIPEYGSYTPSESENDEEESL